MSVSIDAGSTDEFVLALVGAALDGVPIPQPTGPTDKADPTNLLQHELDELARLFGNGEITRGEWAAASEGLRRRLRALADQAPSPAPPSQLELAEFTAQPVETQHRVIRWLFESITVAPHDRSSPRNLAAPEHRTTVEWRV